MKNRPGVGDITFHGKPLHDYALNKITAASIEMGTDQVSEISLDFNDPGFKLLDNRIFDIDTPVKYRGLYLRVSVIETNEGSGLGGFTIRCRPTAVWKLRHLRGDKVRHNITPAAYLASECDLADVGTRPFAQHSHSKKKIARDVKEGGTTYDPASIPSAWTTVQRLATEIGFYAYEAGGVIFFGKPTWLVKKQPKVYVRWYPEDGSEPYTIPEIRESIDSEDIEVNLELPLDRAHEVIPGKGLQLLDFPQYMDTYIITNVSYPLAGPSSNIEVTATTVRNPDPQTNGSLSITGSTPNYDDVSGVRNLAKAICLREYDWGADQFAALNELWQHESGWSYTAENPSSGAYGIPQSLPGNKMATEGADWRTNPETQIRWGLKYIKGRYGSPIAALNFWNANNWY